MKKIKKIKTIREDGITLVALVITIIVLLILAAISIQALTGTGLFGKAKDAEEKTTKAQLKEEIELAIQEIHMFHFVIQYTSFLLHLYLILMLFHLELLFQ